MKPKYFVPFTIIYLCILVVEIYAEHVFKTTKGFFLLAVMQPILLPGLILYTYFNLKGRFSKMAIWIFAGLVLDWISDIILTCYRDEFNLPCMFGYFAGHVCYGIGFVLSVRESGYKVSLINRFIFSLPPIFYIIVYYLFIFNYISTHEVNKLYLVPSGLYVLSIIFMSTTALWRMGTTSETSYWCIATGALFYMLSDSITGYDHFIHPVEMKYVATMFTYGMSLFLFAVGAITHHTPTRKV